MPTNGELHRVRAEKVTKHNCEITTASHNYAYSIDYACYCTINPFINITLV